MLMVSRIRFYTTRPVSAFRHQTTVFSILEEYHVTFCLHVLQALPGRRLGHLMSVSVNSSIFCHLMGLLAFCCVELLLDVKELLCPSMDENEVRSFFFFVFNVKTLSWRSMRHTSPSLYLCSCSQYYMARKHSCW